LKKSSSISFNCFNSYRIESDEQSRPISVPIWLQEAEQRKKANLLKKYETSSKLANMSKESEVCSSSSQIGETQAETTASAQSHAESTYSLLESNKSVESGEKEEKDSEKEVKKEAQQDTKKKMNPVLKTIKKEGESKRNYSVPKARVRKLEEEKKQKGREERKRDRTKIFAIDKPYEAPSIESKKAEFSNRSELTKDKQPNKNKSVGRIHKIEKKKGEERSTQNKLSSKRLEKARMRGEAKIKEGEGLDSLEYFKITNLGRITAANRKPLKQQEDPITQPDKYTLPSKSTTTTTTTSKPKQSKSKDLKQGKDSKTKETKSSNTQITTKPTQQSTDKAKSQAQQEHLQKSFAGGALEDLLTLQSASSNPNLNKADAILSHYHDQTPFLIPSFPSGKSLTIHVLSTWGDKYYVGLAGFFFYFFFFTFFVF
jgi:hypothetical protein